MINMDLDDMNFQMDINSFLRIWNDIDDEHIIDGDLDGIEVIFTNGERKIYFDFWIVDIDTVRLEDENDDEGDTVKFKDIAKMR